MTEPRAPEPLTREAFTAAALRIVDEQGIDALTMRSLGSEMGVHATALYRHFANKKELVEATLAHMLDTSQVAIPAEGTPREQIFGLLLSLRQAFAAHPNFALPNVTMQDEQATSDFVHAALSLLSEMGLSGRHLVVAYQMLETFTVGTNAYDWGDHPRALEARRVGRRLSGHPAFEASSRSLAEMEQINNEAFAVAANALLDACEALAD